MSNKVLYVVQPYKVGTRKTQSLAMIIPAKFARDNEIDCSTIFILRSMKDKTGNVTLQRINCENKRMISTGESLEATTQQISSVGDQ